MFDTNSMFYKMPSGNRLAEKQKKKHTDDHSFFNVKLQTILFYTIVTGVYKCFVVCSV